MKLRRCCFPVLFDFRPGLSLLVLLQLEVEDLNHLVLICVKL